MNSQTGRCSPPIAAVIFLGTTAKFLAAHRSYEKNGFVEIAKDALPSSFSLMAVDTKFHAMRLSSELRATSRNNHIGGFPIAAGPPGVSFESERFSHRTEK